MTLFAYCRTDTLARGFACAGLLTLLAGCGTTAEHVQKREPVFYPAPPAAPRVQFLTSFSTDADMGRRRSRWLRFLIGEEDTSAQLIKPYGVNLHDNKIYVCDTVDRSVGIFDLAARRLRRWAPSGEGRLSLPVHVKFDRDGNEYVADTDRGAVMVYDRAGKFVSTIASVEKMKPSDIAIGGSRLYVADLENHNVAVFDRASRKLLFTIPRDETKTEAGLFSPTNLAIDSSNRVYVSDTGAFCVQVYDAEGHYLRSIGSPGDSPGHFARPKGVAVDHEGRIFVVDAAMQIVQVFSPGGDFMMFFGGTRAGSNELSLPADITIDYDHLDRFKPCAAAGFSIESLLLVTSQYGDHKVSVYGFGHQQ